MQQTFFLQPKPPIWRWLFSIFQLLSERKTAHYLRFQSGFEACSPLTRFTGSSGQQQPAAKVWIKMFIRHLRSSHNCYFPPPQTTLPAATKQPPLPRYGTQRVCKVRSGSFTKCRKKKAQNKKVLNFINIDCERERSDECWERHQNIKLGMILFVCCKVEKG